MFKPHTISLYLNYTRNKQYKIDFKTKEQNLIKDVALDDKTLFSIYFIFICNWDLQHFKY
jgi:hypothetical protein